MGEVKRKELTGKNIVRFYSLVDLLCFGLKRDTESPEPLVKNLCLWPESKTLLV